MAEYIERNETLRRMKIDVRPPFAVVRDMPAADVVEVKHGRWDGEGDGYADGQIVIDVWYCSECGHCIDEGIDDPFILPNYCPNCGAKMDGASWSADGQCSACGEYDDKDPYGSQECPSCGAKMISAECTECGAKMTKENTNG